MPTPSAPSSNPLIDSDSRPVSVDKSGSVGIVWIDNAPVNALSHAVRVGLMNAVEHAMSDPDIDRVVLLSRGKVFIGGADITEFDQAPRSPSLPDVIHCIESSSKPWFAAIHGACLGGGLEVALACHSRIGGDGARLGLPEVMLGLMPGAGGTVRLPRVTGLEAAFSMISNGKPVNAQAARENGLLETVLDISKLPDVIAQVAATNLQTVSTPVKDRPLPGPSDPEGWQTRTQAYLHKHAGLESSAAIVEAMNNAWQLPFDDAQARERTLFDQLKAGVQSQAMRRVFLAERSASKPVGVDLTNSEAVDTVGIIGGGNMGAGIAAACLLKGLSVVLIEQDDDAATAGMTRVFDILANAEKRKLISRNALEQARLRARFTSQWNALSPCQLVIEAVFEDLELKQSVFRKMEQHSASNAILASNTSYLDIGAMAAVLTEPGRAIGLHFFAPAHIMKLLEIVILDSTQHVHIATAFRFGKALGKITIPAGVCDGFIGNRIMSRYRKRCDELLEEGALPQQIDQAMTDFGFAMGIYQVQDLSGLSISWAMRKRQASSRSADERYVHIADRLCELGRLGKGAGKGWYQYDSGQALPDAVVENIILEESERKNITRRNWSSDEIIDEILTAMQSEGERVLQEGVAASPEAIDVVMINGFGFPRWRGGPMFLADSRQ